MVNHMVYFIPKEGSGKEILYHLTSFSYVQKVYTLLSSKLKVPAHFGVYLFVELAQRCPIFFLPMIACYFVELISRIATPFWRSYINMRGHRANKLIEKKPNCFLAPTPIKPCKSSLKPRLESRPPIILSHTLAYQPLLDEEKRGVSVT